MIRPQVASEIMCRHVERRYIRSIAQNVPSIRGCSTCPTLGLIPRLSHELQKLTERNLKLEIANGASGCAAPSISTLGSEKAIHLKPRPLVLKGGNVPEVWAQQYGYGAGAEARRNHRFIRSGEEYRDTAQGHINLLGISEVIEPISTGGIAGTPRYNFPPLFDVFRDVNSTTPY